MSTRDSIMEAIANEGFALAARMDRLTGEDTGLRGRIATSARRLADCLSPTAPNGSAERAARVVMGALWPDEDPPLSFWRSDLGQAVARTIGYHRTVCPFPAAAAILNVTRQRVYQLCRDEQLVRVDSMLGQGVEPGSLVWHLAEFGRRGGAPGDAGTVDAVEAPEAG